MYDYYVGGEYTVMCDQLWYMFDYSIMWGEYTVMYDQLWYMFDYMVDY